MSTKTLGIKKWFQYAAKHNLLLTASDFHRIAQQHKREIKESKRFRTKPVLVVYGIDQDLLSVNIDRPDYLSRSPFHFFNYREFWMNLGTCSRQTYGSGITKVWDCKFSSITDGMPDVFTENDYRIQFDQDPKSREFGYLQWDDGDDAFTRYMTAEQMSLMPNICNDGTWPDR